MMVKESQLPAATSPFGGENVCLAVGAFEDAAIGMAMETDFEPFDVVFFVDTLGHLHFLPGVAVARLIRLSL
jgi:hypothetical protein